MRVDSRKFLSVGVLVLISTLAVNGATSKEAAIVKDRFGSTERRTRRDHFSSAALSIPADLLHRSESARGATNSEMRTSGPS